MKAELTATGVLALAAVAGLGALYLFNRRAIHSAVAAAGDAVNPASQTNIVNRGLSAAGAAVTGDDSWSLGGQLAEWFSPSVAAANEALRGPVVPSVDQSIMDANDARARPGTGAGTGVTGGW